MKKLSEYIENLKDILEEYGDLDVVYAKDEEGNGFNEVCYTPSVGYYEDREFTSIDEKDEDDEDDIKINAVCIN